MILSKVDFRFVFTEKDIKESKRQILEKSLKKKELKAINKSVAKAEKKFKMKLEREDDYDD